MRDKRINIFDILKNEGKLEILLIYSSKEIEIDPYEHTKENIYNNAIPVKALILSIGFSTLKWKYWGQLPIGSIQVLTEIKDKNLLLTANKIKYNDNYYYVYKDDSKNFQYLERKDYCIFILGLKNQEE